MANYYKYSTVIKDYKQANLLPTWDTPSILTSQLKTTEMHILVEKCNYGHALNDTLPQLMEKNGEWVQNNDFTWRNLTVARMVGLCQSSAVPKKLKNKQGVAPVLVNDGESITFWHYRGPSLNSRTALFPSSVQGHNS